MKHALRKYITPCGSALFMVVSTMAALIVLVTAMYMSVLSSRQVQYATFDQEQAYVASSTIADGLRAYLAKEGKNGATVKKLTKMEVGDVYSTDGNGFASFDAGTTPDTVLGAYDATITRLGDETIGTADYFVFDIAVTVSENGAVETTHTLVTYPKKTDGTPPVIKDFFAATGYTPNDVTPGGGTFTESMRFDAEYTMFTKPKGFDSQALSIDTDMVCAGSVVFDHKSANPVQASDTLEWYVGNNFYVRSQPDKFDLGGKNGQMTKAEDEQHGKIVIGGDFEMGRINNCQIGAPDKYTDVYVLGNCYIGSLKIYGNLYVAGDVIFINSNWNEMGVKGYGKYYIDGNVYARDGVTVHLNGQNKTEDSLEEAKQFGRWADIQDDEYFLTSTEIAEKLNRAIGTNTFYNWTIDDDEFVQDAKGNPKKIDINFQMSGESPKFVYEINENVVIGKIKSTGNYVDAATIVIDTGDEGDVRILRVSANCADGESFSWCPETVLDGRKMNVLTKGKGTLVIDVPEGVRYQATDQEFFGHMGWFFLSGGKLATNSGSEYFDRRSFELNNPDTGFIKPNNLIHTTCSNCEYTTGTDDSGEYYQCTKHPDHYTKHYGLEEAPTSCICAGHLDTDKVTSYANSKGISLDYHGEEQMPNVNIYVISSKESADIQFGGDNVMNNIYYGYVYAPYMTYVDKGFGGGVKIVGGLIVSDYVITGYYRYVHCLPTLPISDVMQKCGVQFTDDWMLDYGGSRAWRVFGM